ncbi:hypothetical protein C8R45DRAFT_825763, partial [Mycena sanguinolenta]
MLIETINKGKDEKTKLLKLFGAVTVDTDPVKIAIYGACRNAGRHTATAGAAIYFGPGSRQNSAVRIWGNQTNSRADLIALLLAIRSLPRRKTVQVSTRSEYAIRSIKYYAAGNDACGWTCPNGDVLKLIVQWIRARQAPIHFVHIKKDAVDGYIKSAMKLAKDGCNL